MTIAVIHRKETEERGRYWLELDGHEAKLTFSKTGPDQIVIDHTGVPRELGGKGIGTLLVERAVEDALAEGRKIVPLCSFARAKIDKTPEWRGVLD